MFLSVAFYTWQPLLGRDSQQHSEMSVFLYLNVLKLRMAERSTYSLFPSFLPFHSVTLSCQLKDGRQDPASRQ